MVKRIPKGPKFVSYFWPIIEVLKMLGGSARPAEVREQLVRTLNISEDAQADTLPSGLPRFYLSKAGIIDSSARGVWTLTEKGRALEQLNHQEAVELCYAI